MTSLPTARYRAIRTKFAGPTDARGSRIVADAGDAASRVVVGYDPALNLEQNHAAAAVAVTAKMGWTGGFFSPLAGGEYRGAYYWTFQPAAEGAGR